MNLTTEINAGRAFVELINRARELESDLIVVGARGATSLEEIIDGGTAEKMARQAPCSVLVVR